MSTAKIERIVDTGDENPLSAVKHLMSVAQPHENRFFVSFDEARSCPHTFTGKE